MRFGGPDDPILLDACLTGGQAFRWTPTADGFLGVVGDRHWRVRPLPDGGVDARLHPRAGRTVPTRYFRLDDDYAAALARLREDPFLAVAIERYAGLRVLRQDPWETLVAFVTSANNNVKRIALTLDRLARAAGEARESPWGAYHAFPDPAAVAALDEGTLRALGFGYRAPFILGTARAVAAGDVDLEGLRTRASLHEARDALLTLPGVGPKVAACVALFALDKTDAFPVDRWIARVVTEAYARGRALPPGEAAALARERWGRDAGLAQQFLFHAARLRRVA